MLLDAAATQIYSKVKSETAAVTAQVDQAIEAKISAQGNVALTAKQLEEVLLQAMPSHAQAIQKACSCVTHQCDGKNGKFVSTVATLMIEKDRAEVYSPPPAIPVRPVYRDPLHAELIIGKDADFVVIVNAGVFDDQKRPLAMKVLARERADCSKIAEALKPFHTLWEGEPDIIKIPNDAAYYKTSDMQEKEFQFGHGIAVVSLDKHGKEMGRNGKIQPQNRLTTRYYYGKQENGATVPDLTKPVGGPQLTQGPQLDTTAVQSYQKEIELKLALADTAPKGGWLDTRAQFLNGSIQVGQGYVLEPGGQGTIQFLNSTMAANVAADDFSFKGSAPSKVDLNIAPWANYTLQQILNQNMVETTRSVNGSDQRQTNTLAKDFLYRNADQISIGNAAFVPLADTMLTSDKLAPAGVKASLQPLENDAQSDGFCVALDLSKGFVSSKKASQLAGWTIEVGYNSPNGWVQADTKKIGSGGASDSTCFQIAVDNPTEAIAANRNLEIRVRNESGLPAARVMVPFKEMKWSA
jgi:hypothetical protein